jgi:hypothetical protein
MPAGIEAGEVGQARAAGVLIEFERGTPIICDRSLYRELVKQAITRTVEELRERKAERDAERAQARRGGGGERTPGRSSRPSIAPRCAS